MLIDYQIVSIVITLILVIVSGYQTKKKVKADAIRAGQIFTQGQRAQTRDSARVELEYKTTGPRFKRESKSREADNFERKFLLIVRAVISFGVLIWCAWIISSSSSLEYQREICTGLFGTALGYWLPKGSK